MKWTAKAALALLCAVFLVISLSAFTMRAEVGSRYGDPGDASRKSSNSTESDEPGSGESAVGDLTVPSESGDVPDEGGDAPSMSAPSESAPSVSGNPVNDNPVNDNPVSGNPASDTPPSDDPASDTPASDTPPSDDPASDTPASGDSGNETGKEKKPLAEKLFIPMVIVIVLLAAAVAWLIYDKFRVSSVPGPVENAPRGGGAQPNGTAPGPAVPKTLQPTRQAPFNGSAGIYSVGNLHNVGKREEQQDSFCISDIRDTRSTSEKGLLAVVADGMGGLQGGAAISQLVTDTFLKNYKALSISDPDAFLNDCTHKAQAAVRDYMALNGVKGGSTLVAVLVKDGKIHFLSIGDSRIYLMRNGMLGKLNHAHNYGAVLKEQAARGEVDPEEPYVNPRKDALTSYIGIENLRLIDRGVQPLKPGDKLMLCSDGVFNALGDDALTRLLSAPAPDAAMSIEQAVLGQNLRHQDNFTAILIDAGGTVK